MSGALRFNEGKPKLGYFARSFPKMLEAVARVKEFGANKYDEGNWRLGNKPDEEYLDSMARHLDYFLKGEHYDQDSACLHLAHAVWNLSALLELNYPDLPAIDSEKFAERMTYWAEKKNNSKEKKNGCCEGASCDGECRCGSPVEFPIPGLTDIKFALDLSDTEIMDEIKERLRNKMADKAKETDDALMSQITGHPKMSTDNQVL